MFPKDHVILGLLFSILVYLLFPVMGFLGFSLIFLSSIFIDVDHYLIYAVKKKDFSLERAYSWFEGMENKIVKYESKNPSKKVKAPFCVLHTFEFLTFMVLLSYFFYPLFFILIGFLFHSFLDFISLNKKGLLRIREFSLFLYISRKNKKGWIYI